MSSNLSELNNAQRQAVEATEGPVLIIAGAGAGKTKTITYRILNLIQKGVAPESILAVTFTNKAAQEMLGRVEKLLAESLELNRPTSIEGKPFISTFHSLGALIIKENAEEARVKKHFSIFDREDSKKVIRESLKNNGYDPKQFEPGKILSIISREKGNFISSEEYSEAGANSFFGELVSKVWQDYEIALKKENALDFDDLLLVAAQLLQDEKIRQKYSQRWQYVHIDEYQDTNKVQYQIAEAIVKDHKNICVVGDVDQNIYTWRNASIKNILNFERDFKNTKIILLEENYRSTQTILSVANRAIEKNKIRHEKILVTNNAVGERIGLFDALTESHEARFVVEKAKELQKKGVDLSDIAVLYRANFQSRVLEEEFLAGEVPYQILGTRFFERKEIKDILAFLRFAFNPESISDLKRIINVPPRGIGKITLLKIVEGKGDNLPPKMKIKLAAFKELIKRIKKFAETNPPSKTILFIAKETGLGEKLGQSEEDAERIENIKELAVLAKRYDQMYKKDENLEEERNWEIAIEKLLEDTSLASDQDSEKKEQDGVRLMTIHASKGLEFSYVFITGLEEGLFPHDRDQDEILSEEEAEEERRLFYVALTRAKKKLFLSYAQTRTIFGNKGSNIPSEFLLEIPDEYLEREFLDYIPKHKSLLHIEF
ncbi:MAG: UvrD-helicase domain-containing protein [Candidatus Zambryskibacteria bacterium]|nr:UvrD-helicase domain-containing protein [Candidatus Zambryskibacteria bacterium]